MRNPIFANHQRKQDDPTMMRRRSGEYDPVLNAGEAEKIGDIEKDGFKGEAFIITEHYAFSSAKNPRIVIVGPAASRLINEGHRQARIANQDWLKGCCVLTLEEAEELGIYTIQKSSLTFTPLEESNETT